jgi:subtilisin-like proprotein convertase family protein
MRTSLQRLSLALVATAAFGAGSLDASTEGLYRGASRAVQFDVSPPWRDIPQQKGLAEPKPLLLVDPESGLERAYGPQDADGALQDWTIVGGLGEIPLPTVSFNAQPNIAGVAPPDPVGDIGPSHYVAMSNLHTQMFNRAGTSVFGPVATNSIWAGFGGPCQNENAGDPIVLYDQFADRWLITQFTAAGPTFFNCVALSTSGDPTGTYYRYAFSTGTNFPDYPKYGVWRDGYYISTREFAGAAFAGVGAYALERDEMLAGNPAPQVISFLVPPGGSPFNVGDGLLPADVDGYTLPPAGAPAYYVGSMDNGGPYGAAADALTLWKFVADFATPPSSSFTLTNTIPIAAYDTIFNDCAGRACIPQPGTTNRLDILSYRQRPLHRLAYRNFGTHESLVTNQSVEAATGPSMAGIRWWEIRSPNAAPIIFQEGTYAPGTTDGIHRWMGSIAMDRQGNMALGYSASDDNNPAPTGTFPSSWYTGRLVGDPLGTMPQGEESIIDGTGSQTGGGNRWGDYTSMNVDPIDDCGFWYVNEWVPTTSASGWQLRVGAFTFPGCPQPAFTLGATPSQASVCAGANANYTIDVGSLLGFVTPVSLGLTGNPPGTGVVFGTNPVTPPNTSALTVNNTAAVPSGNYLMTVTGTGGGLTRSRDIVLSVVSGAPAAPTLVSPSNGASGVSTSPTLTWNAVAGATSYLVQVDDNADFSSPEFSATVAVTSAAATGLATDTLYHWRVTANNTCGGTASTVFTFSTGILYCSSPNLAIPDNNPTGVSNVLAVAATGEIADLDVQIVMEPNHTWIGDTIFTLGHGATTVTLIDRPGRTTTGFGCSADMDDVTLDDEAATPIETPPGCTTTSTVLTGSFSPNALLSGFDGQDINGNWTLTASDVVGGDTGTIASWCLIPVFAEPDIVVDPTAIAETVPPDSTVDVALDIDNVGTGTLDWTIEEEPVLAPAPRAVPPVAFDARMPAFETLANATVDFDGAAARGDVTLWEAPQGGPLWDNGPLVTHPGGGAGGADASRLQNSSLGMTVNGFTASTATVFRISDDFAVPGPSGWDVATITFFGYQTGSTTTCTFNDARVQIWDGPPNAGGSIIYGDLTTNRFASCAFSNIYRDTETTVGNNQRPIMAVTATIGTSLPPGDYWVDFQLGGTLASGPFIPPLTVLTQTSGCTPPASCNGLQWNGSAWVALDDGLAGTQPQDVRFIVDGTLSVCSAPSDVPWLSVSATSGSTPAGGTSTVDVTLDTTGLTPGVYEANLCIDSDDPDTPLVVVPVTLTADSMPFLDGFETGDTSRWSATQN